MRKLKIQELVLAALMTAVLAILSPISIPIGPVPISLGTFAVCLSVTILGKNLGTVSYLTYLLLGLAGLPVFSNYEGGLAKLLGPTGGYLIGMLFLSLLGGFGAVPVLSSGDSSLLYHGNVVAFQGSLLGLYEGIICWGSSLYWTGLHKSLLGFSSGTKGESDSDETERRMLEQFSRTELLLGRDAIEKLSRAKVIVFGVGGVGGYAVEALARSGVGRIDLVDKDTVSLSNLNRQLIATRDTVGREKVEVMAERIHSINPDCEVQPYCCFYLPDTKEQFDFSAYDYIIDAVDTVTAKLSLICEAERAGTPIISAMGAGNKLNPAAFKVSDIYQTRVCPLARVMRRECKKRGINKLKVVYSEENPQKPQTDRGVPGSVPFVPPAAGLILASEVVRDLLMFL